MSDSLIEAILQEPERFLKYIPATQWKKIKNFGDFATAINKAFGKHFVGRNIYKSNRFNKALKILYNHKYAQKRVKSNIKKITKKQERIEEKIQKEEKIEAKKRAIKERDSNKYVHSETKSGTKYIRGNRHWTDREESWLKKNINTMPSLLEKLFNAVFKNRSYESIVTKRRRIK